MANFYLDKAGLERLWGHIVALVNEAIAGGSGTDNEGNIIFWAFDNNDKKNKDQQTKQPTKFTKK